MKVFYGTGFKRKFRYLPKLTRQKFRKQVGHLIKNLRHPSLRAKKYDEANDIWQARVDDNYRFYFLIKGDTYFLIDLKPHPK